MYFYLSITWKTCNYFWRIWCNIMIEIPGNYIFSLCWYWNKFINDVWFCFMISGYFLCAEVVFLGGGGWGGGCNFCHLCLSIDVTWFQIKYFATWTISFINFVIISLCFKTSYFNFILNKWNVDKKIISKYFKSSNSLKSRI